jgi:hypothetical protein
MTRSEANTFLEDASRNERFLTRGGVREERWSCLVCDVRIDSGDPTIQIRGVVSCAWRPQRRSLRRRCLRKATARALAVTVGHADLLVLP